MRRAIVAFVPLVLVAAGLLLFSRHVRIERPAKGDGDKDLRDLPYARFSEKPTARDQIGVVSHDPEKTGDGYTLFNPLMDTAHLIDMRGRIVHSWSYRPPEDGSGPTLPTEGPGSRWMATRMLDDGSLILLLELNFVLHLSWESELIAWTRLTAHHDISRGPDGTFYTLVNDVRVLEGHDVRFSKVARLDGQLKLLSSASLFQHRRTFRNDRLEAKLAKIRGKTKQRFDYFHENTISVIGDHANAGQPAWKPGNLITCLRNVDRVVVLHPDTLAPLWSWGAEELEAPHHPTVLPSGNLLVFDNGRRRKRSRVIEYDPREERIVWQYPTREADVFFTEAGGSALRLPNGNTLICDSDNGRAIEVTPAGRIVWKFLNPNMGRPPLSDTWHRGRIYRMLRYPAELVDGLRKSRGARPGPRPEWWPAGGGR